MSNDKFSILLPTKNRPKFLRRAVQAILGQDHTNLELIIKDGGDRDCDLPTDSRITYIRSKDRNVAHALNTATGLATGNIWHRASDDDVMEPGALTHVARHLGDAHWLYGKIEVVDKSTGVTFVTGGEAWDPARHLTRNLCPQPATFWRRALHERVIPGEEWWSEDLSYACDYHLTLKFGAYAPPKVVETILARYTLHDGAMSVRCAADRADHMTKARAVSVLATDMSKTKV